MKKSPNRNSVPDELRARLGEANKRLEQAVQALDRNDSTDSIACAQDVLHGTLALIDRIAANYREALLNGKLSHLAGDKTTLETFAAAGQEKMNVDQFLLLLTRLDRALALAEKEINRQYPPPFPGVEFFRRHTKAVAVGLIGTIAIVGGSGIWRAVESRGRGLKGAYFDGAGFQHLYRERLDKKIDFEWEMKSPFPGWKPDDFSVRWTGYLRVEKPGAYEFFTHSDDGVRLKIDGTTVIENWTVHRVAVDRGSMTLSKGLHPITLEYFEDKRRAVLQLYWKSESDSRPSIVPASHLTTKRE